MRWILVMAFLNCASGFAKPRTEAVSVKLGVGITIGVQNLGESPALLSVSLRSTDKSILTPKDKKSWECSTDESICVYLAVAKPIPSQDLLELEVDTETKTEEGRLIVEISPISESPVIGLVRFPGGSTPISRGRPF